MHEDPTDDKQNVIGVVICTAQRPKMLESCIKSILTQENLPDGFRHEIVVVENDTNPLMRTMIDTLGGKTNIPIHYSHEPERGIPIARNKTITEALRLGYDWIALIDDDERAEPQWLSRLINAARNHHADVANGPVVRHYEGKLPDWWRPLKTSKEPTGSILDEAPTNNTLLSSRLVRKDGLNLRFDNRLTFGYEDIDFFKRAHDGGAKIIWVPDAIVEEDIPASRMTNKRLIQRVEMQAAGIAFATKIRKGSLKAWLRFGPKGIRRIVTGSLMFLATPFSYLISRQTAGKLFYRSIARVMKGWGHLRGLTRFQPNYYAKIDGE